MSTAKMTLIGMYNYNPHLFDNLSVPEDLDADVLINHILLRGGEFEVAYADPDFVKDAIGNWSSVWFKTMEKWVAALSLEYNPIENYDRQESWTDTGSSSGTDSSSGSVEDKTSAFDSNTYQPESKTESSTSGQTSASSSNTHTARIHGNIGVTTSQQMLQSELDLAEWSVYEHITDLFLYEFVIPVY